MNRLEQFIRDRRSDFDGAEPDPGHFARFEARLAEEPPRVVTFRRRYPWMRAAAVAVVLLTAGLAGYEMLSGRAFSRTGDRFAAVVFSEDTQEALDFYAQTTGERMSEIDRLAKDCPDGAQLKNQAVRESAVFDANQEELTLALKENPGNEKVEAAMIRNQKLKEEALSNIILQGNLEHCNKK